MTVNFQVLGAAGRDNAVLVTIDSGQKVDRLLFDCGEGCLSALAVSEIQAIDHLLFSHFHMDHISGFDTFFRLNYDRTTRSNVIWGPPGSGKVMHHRFRGFLWNLYWNLTSQWFVNDIYPDHIDSIRCDGHQAFEEVHALGTSPSQGCIIDTPNYSVEALTMNHQAASMAYIVREKPRTNVDTTRLAELGLKPGGWIRQVKDVQLADDSIMDIDGKSYTLADLRRELLSETPGQSLAYLTDFILDEAAQEKLVDGLRDCTTMICESQYRAADIELATRNFHMTAVQVAETAQKANVQDLILFHVSDRYDMAEWAELLNEARAIFPGARFPDAWGIV